MSGFLLLSLSLATPSEGADRRNDIVRAVERVGPAVVNINTYSVEESNPFWRRGRVMGPGFFVGPRSGERLRKRQSLGSGVIIRSDGYILTNNHVIDGASDITVTLADEREFRATAVGADPNSDLAVIKVNSPDPLPVAPLGRSNDLMIGETVIAIGNPFGLTHTVTTGIVSAVDRDIQLDKNRSLADFIQVDASINPGNSGGALLNINGQLIGVTTAIQQDAEGIGFAIPIDRARRIFEALVNYGTVQRGWSGLFVSNLSAAIRQRLAYRGKGLLVTEVFNGSPAHRAGLQPGDIITMVNARHVGNRLEYAAQMDLVTEGNRVTFDIWRFGKKGSVTFIPAKVTPRLARQVTHDWVGVMVGENDRGAHREYRLRTERGVVVQSVERDSGLGKIGLRPGDLIRRVNSVTTDSVKSLYSAVMEAFNNGSAIIYIQRGDRVYQVSL